MYRSLKKRILSGLLAGLMTISNVNITANAADIAFEASVDADDNITVTEENDQTYDSGQDQETADSAPEDSSVDSDVDFAEEEDADFSDGNIETDQAGTDDSRLFALEEDAPDVGDETSEESENTKFRVQGTVAFDEKLGDTDWKSLVRPTEFAQPIKVVLKYKNENSEDKEVQYDVQDDLSKNDFYLKFAHDGDGAGDFVIENIPKKVTADDGKEYDVTECEIKIEPSLPYYKCDMDQTIKVTPSDISAALGTLTLTLKSETLILNPTVIPENSSGNPSFKMNAEFINSALTDEEDSARKLQKTYVVSKTGDGTIKTEIQVPVGISYNVTQTPADGYKFDGNYTTTKEGTVTTISTVNYAQNVSIGFDVNWLDNNKVTRSKLSESNFVLQYKTTEGEWTNLTSDHYEELGIDENNSPKFDASLAAQNQYSYTGLPAVNKNKEQLEYQVIVKTAPDGYVSTYEDNLETGRRTFTFEEQTSFSATIVWNDEHENTHRPSDTDSSDTITEYKKKLKLYRKVEGGKYELVYDDELPDDALTITADDAIWSVNINKLPRYDSENKEYDYVLVQGSINENEDGTTSVAQTTVNEYYRTYYDNGSGNFGNDVSLCHNNGKITQVLHKNVAFQANKVWKNPDGEKANRPTSTVTLWRYVKGTAEDIDDAYTNGKAAKVIFQTTNVQGEVEENITSYDINNQQDSADIKFTWETVNGMPENYELPAYDDHGREYIYFVRESLSGAHADDYEIQYTYETTDENGQRTTNTCKNGAPTGGTITNVRREKSAVAITKIWQNPAGLDAIDGAAVQVRIKASADGGQNYEELTVYSSSLNSYEILGEDEKKTAQTITGFTSSIAQGEATYYVNTYDSQGRPYDMEKAQIIETVTTKDGKTYDVTTVNDQSVLEMGDQKYVVKSAYVELANLSNGMKQYRYTQKNTITATRNYKLIKEWGSGITSDDVDKISTVNFELKRRTTKDNPDGTTAAFEPVFNENGENFWTVSRDAEGKWNRVIQNLPQYDDEGYEYYYQATEVSFTNKDNTTTTVEVARRDKNWYGEHYYTPDQTRVINHVVTNDGGFFTISKIWQDNGDIENRKNVQVRIYRRSDLQAALVKQKKDSNKTDTDIVDLDALNTDTANPVKYHQETLTSNDQYTEYVYYSELEKSIDGKEWENSSTDDWTNYIVLEYAVGDKTTDSAEQAQYTYKQLMDAVQSKSTYNVSGTAVNSIRQYRTNIAFQSGNNRVVLITNTRTGTTSIQATKIWKDENNASALRPASVQFQLYRDGSPYTDIPDKVVINVDSAQLDHKTGIITVSSQKTSSGETNTGNETENNNTESQWTFTLTGLDMFSSTAVPYTYNLDELALSTGSEDSNYSYIQKKTEAEVKDTNKTQTYTFAFENTITGTVSHIAYKYWQDAGVGASNRPDLYMNLYRYLKKDLTEAREKNPDATAASLSSDKLTLYTDYKDQIWTAAADDGREYEHGYNWKIMVNDLPRFDADGNEYGYIFTEKMNNDGKTVLGTYVSSSETEEISGIDDTYEVFTNTISDYMTIQGKKTWTGLAGYQTKEDELPDPLISLYRTTNSEITDLQSKTDDEVKQLIKNNTITLVDTTHLTGSKEEGNDKTRYAFPDTEVTSEEKESGLISLVGEAKTPMLPKFDANGNRYTYLVRETMDSVIAGQLYSQVNKNGTLSNVFRKDVNRRYIKVTKTWAGRENLNENEKKYPSVTYTLYRYEAGKESNTTTKIETHTINSSEFTGESGKASYTFENLLVYSPTGVQYYYYIEEKAINGYTITYTDEAGVTEDLKTNQRIDVTSLPEKWNDKDASEEDLTTSVGTCNTYDAAGKIQISGQKVWEDYGNSERLRPAEIAVVLKRYTNNESGQNNRVDLNNAQEIELTKKGAEDPTNTTTPYIVWNNGTDSATSSAWNYTIYNLERYAPNGMPYIYTLAENPNPVTGYKMSNSVNGQASGNIKMSAITNSFDGSYYVRKNWMDGNNKYNLRPAEITVKLQRSTDDGKTWSDMICPEGAGTYDTTTGKWTGLPSVIKNDKNEKIVSITLNAKYVKKNTKNNTWEYTFTNLPTQYKEGKKYKKYTYRCVETAIGGVPITESTQTDGSAKYSAGAYECKYTTQNETQTIIENTLNSTSLVVTKNWEGDQDNFYQTRPDKLTFVLQKRGVRVKNEEEITPTPTLTPETTDTVALTSEDSEEDQLSDWTDVLLANGKPYTFTISPDSKGNWTKTLEDLPTAEVYTAADGTKYTIYSLYFRAVEVHADDMTDLNGNKKHDGKIVSGAQNYEDTTDYILESSAHNYDEQAGCNVSTITNTLRLDNPTKSIIVTKKWKRVSGAEVTATFELLYKTTGETEWHSYGDKRQLTVSGTATSTQTVKWEKLPKYDRNGRELVYKVVEYPINGYKTEISSSNDYTSTEGTDSTPYDTKYTFINIELQDYTVKKIWKNTDYAEKTDVGYTATFKLQQKVEGTTTDAEENVWKDVSGVDSVTLTSQDANDTTKNYTWHNLPKYTVDGKEIAYRAVETQINGKNVTNNTNGSYIVSYEYKGQDEEKTEPAFGDTETTATNRMIYGFVNLSKQAAYLAPGITDSAQNGESQIVKLEGVKFNIYQGTENLDNAVPYVSDVETDENGNLKNTNGKYGEEQKYLIAGTYTLKETATLPEYSVWKDGVTFTVGSGALSNNLTENAVLTDTGEHGTAWISTTGIGQTVLGLKVEYKPAASDSGHTFGDSCKPYDSGEAAVNLESRGVISFTKTGPESAGNADNTALDIHDGASGESSAYFGVYLDEACKQQVAGMVPKATSGEEKAKMILTNKARDGRELPVLKKDDKIPYLRAFSSANGKDFSDYPFTLLSGTYYIKELVAPAGYKLDETVRKAEIAKIDSVSMGNLTELYPNNKAKISSLASGDETASTEYKWSNEPNVVTLYKMDQFGRKAPLAKNGYLELSVVNATGENNTFPSGESTIRLYQSTDTPVTKGNGSKFDKGFDYISYDAEKGAWTIKGLLDINKTYTLSEPVNSVHANYVVANAISFKMNADGTMALVNTDTTGKNQTIESKDNPLNATGGDYKNYYKADAKENVIVMRDVARYLKDIVLEKKDSKTEQPIQHISFKLYKYDTKTTDANGKTTYTGQKSVLEDNVYLTTDTNGKIELQSLNDEVINQITGHALKYGLDTGNYYFEEVERGASDNYRLLEDKIFFEIKPKKNGIATDYSDYATVTYNTADSHVSTPDTGEDNKTVIVTNDSVTSQQKTLELIKVDSKNTETKLGGAKFTLTYQSINHGHTGSSTSDDNNKNISWNCITDTDGVLYLTDDSGQIKTDKDQNKIKPDISSKGTYTLKEVQAPDGYMTRTDNGTIVTMVTFKVDSSNQITEVKYYDGNGNLVENPSDGNIVTGSVSTDAKTEHLALNLIVKNEKTKVSIAKQNDIESGKKTCDQKSLNGERLSGAGLEIYEGTGTTDTDKRVAVLGINNNQSKWNWTLPDGQTSSGNGYDIPEGVLKENTIYTLHESSTPVGYLTADDIYFKLSGTTTKDNTIVSQLYVWTGSEIPTSTDGTAWKSSTSTPQSPTNLKDNVLTMVDEAIIAPVDLQKVVGPENSAYQVLEGAEFEVKAGNTVLGTARSAGNGYLVWKEITEDGYTSKLIFNESGKRATEADKNTVIGKTMILQQNAEGYTFTETYTPDNAYNDGKSFTVKITADNYKEYCKKTTTTSNNTTMVSRGYTYDTTAYVDIKAASEAKDGAGKATYIVDKLSHRTSDTDKATAGDFVNPPYKSTVTLHKYDADEEGKKAAIPGTEFTLYRVSDNKETVYTNAYIVENNVISLRESGVFTTDKDGNLAIEIHEKGTYILKETKAAAGYQLDEKNSFEFKLADNADPSTNPVTYGYLETEDEANVLQKNSDGVPNQRNMGEVNLTKKDDKTDEALDGVVYTLTRSDKPTDSKGIELSDYLLKDSVDVVTGKSYKAEKVNGKWNLTELTDSSKCKSGEIHITGLNWGTYTLTEKTELSGYKLEKDANGKVTNSHMFTINGKSTAKDGSCNALSFIYNDTNTKNSVTFYKTNQVDSEAGVTTGDIKGLAGAVFEVHEGEPDTNGENSGTCKKVEFYAKDTDQATSADSKSKKVTTVTTDENGKVTIYGLTTDTSDSDNPKIYHLVEVKAPKGYKLQTQPVVFTIDRQGKVQLKTTDSDGTTAYIDAPWDSDSTEVSAVKHPMVTMTDEAIKIYIQKFGEDESVGLGGAEFVLQDACSDASGDANCDHKLANNAVSENIIIPKDTTDGKIMIPIERVIGGHTYTLRETKAPDGYECTAVVTFHVKTDGTIDTISSTGGYKGYTDAEGNAGKMCASLDKSKTTIKIQDEKVRMSLTKVDYSDTNEKLQGVTFTLTPYENVDGSTEKSSFKTPYDISESGNISYDSENNTYTFKTDSEGKITFPDGLLKHNNSYLLKETATIKGYYLSKEAKAGVILKVGKDGGIKIERLPDYKDKTMDVNGTSESSCPVTVTSEAGNSNLLSRNMKSASFELTKKVEGNMGDLSGTFQIKMEVYEPDGTAVGERTINLKLNEKYDSVNGLLNSTAANKQAFGTDEIPVGSTLVIKEDNELDYAAVVKILNADGTVKETINPESNNKGTVKVTLDSIEKVIIELTNQKNVTIDVGVNPEDQAPWAVAALIIPALWLAYRYRRKRRGGEA